MRTGERWTNDEDWQLCKLVKSGVTYKEAAILLERTENSIVHRVRLLGIGKNAHAVIMRWGEKQDFATLMEGK